MTDTLADPRPAPGAAAGDPPMVELRGISKRFVKSIDLAERIANLFGANRHEQVVRAVDDVNMTVNQGEVVGLVGESGCGKSTLGRVVAGIHAPTEGTMLFQGKALSEMRASERAKAKLKIQMIFQDPMSSLNPRKRVAEIVGEAPRVHGLVSPKEVGDYVSELLLRVGLDPSYKARYPHQFSGGQRQRIGIARALAVKPEFLVCDESVAALDVSIQAQVLNLFMDLRKDLGLTYLFISHDLGVVEHLSDRVVETCPTEMLFTNPNHPYTQALLDEVPRITAKKRQFRAIKGEIPSPLNPPPGCHFHSRCPKAFDRCKVERPLLKQVRPGQFSACHLND
jgi:peptide/nickel transport system ATP-binding protein